MPSFYDIWGNEVSSAVVLRFSMQIEDLLKHLIEVLQQTTFHLIGQGGVMVKMLHPKVFL